MKILSIGTQSSVNATNNWWGKNTTPTIFIGSTTLTTNDIWRLFTGGTTDGLLSYDPWLVLSLKASPNSINTGQTSTITADLNKNSNAQDIATLYPGKFVPDGIITNFSSDAKGSVNPTSNTTTNGAANTTFTGTTPGLSTVSAAIDGQTVNTNVNINSPPLIPTALVVDPVSGFIGDIVDLTATLTDTQNNIPVQGKEIQFSVNGLPVGSAFTDINGLATLQYFIDGAFLLPGTYTILGEFLGDEYAATSSTNTLTVNHLPTAIVVDPVSGFKGDIVDLVAKLTYTHNNVPLDGQSIDFSVNGNFVGTAITDINGIATLPYTILQNSGTYTILAQFQEDSYYAASSNTNTLNVDHIATAIVVNPVSGFKGNIVNLIATLSDTHNNVPLDGQTIQFSVNGNIVGTAQTNSNGIATLPYTILQNTGTYTILAQFFQDTAYASSSNTNTLKVLDNIPPVVTGSSPANNAVNVALNTIIKITFNKGIKFGNNPWIELVGSNGSAILFTSSITGSTLFITPNSLLTAGTKYTAVVHSNAVTNLNGIGLAAPYITKFTTTTPPVVTGSSPANNAVNAALNTVVKITFNKGIKLGTNPWVEFVYNNGTTKPFKLSVTGSTLNITPTTSLTKATNYTVVVHSNAVTDLNGTGLAAPYKTKFTTT